jgi:hypothetical protein
MAMVLSLLLAIENSIVIPAIIMTHKATCKMELIIALCSEGLKRDNTL